VGGRGAAVEGGGRVEKDGARGLGDGHGGHPLWSGLAGEVCIRGWDLGLRVGSGFTGGIWVYG
jgi:hypothetical protein